MWSWFDDNLRQIVGNGVKKKFPGRPMVGRDSIEC